MNRKAPKLNSRKERSAAKQRAKIFGVRRLVDAWGRRDLSRRAGRRVARGQSGDKSPHSQKLAAGEDSDAVRYEENRPRNGGADKARSGSRRSSSPSLRFLESFAAKLGITRFHEDSSPQISQIARMQEDPSRPVFIRVICEIGGSPCLGCGFAAL